MFWNEKSTVMMLFCLYVAFNTCIGSYFVSHNPMDWPRAESYCTDYCKSHLVSIHNQTQFNTIKEILDHTLNATNPPLNDTITYPHRWATHNPNIWVGLNRTGDGLYDLSWSDHSQFDFNTWDDYEDLNEPSNSGGVQSCVALNTRHDYTWNDIECDYEMRFVCNSCTAKTNKYLLIKLKKPWEEAQSYCRAHLGTDLASIHNEADYLETKALCGPTGDECWIGFNDHDTEEHWVWSDATTSDFGSDTPGGIYPWNDDEPNNYLWYGHEDVGEDCATLTRISKDNKWNDELCVVDRYFICNAQSALCTKQHWQSTGDLVWSEDDSCQIESQQTSQSIIHNRKWTRGDDIWLIDYMYTVHNVYNGNGRSGIVIYHFDNVCDYYFAAIGIDADNNATIVVDKHVDGTTVQLHESQKLFTYEFDRYYTLRVQLSYDLSSIQWNISIITNEIYTIAFTDTSSGSYVGNDRYIGLKNSDANTTAKSLFISDASQYITDLNVSLEDCAVAPTNNPSSSPSGTPTSVPSYPTSYHPSHVPTKQPILFETTNPSVISSEPTILSSFDPTVYPTSDSISTSNIGHTNAKTSDTTEYMDNTWLGIAIALGSIVAIVLICLAVAVVFHCNSKPNKFVIQNDNHLMMKKAPPPQPSGVRNVAMVQNNNNAQNGEDDVSSSSDLLSDGMYEKHEEPVTEGNIDIVNVEDDEIIVDDEGVEKTQRGEDQETMPI